MKECPGGPEQNVDSWATFVGDVGISDAAKARSGAVLIAPCDPTLVHGKPQAADESVAEIPPELIDHSRYRVVKKRGHGGMGSVFQTEHRLMKRTVALLRSYPG